MGVRKNGQCRRLFGTHKRKEYYMGEIELPTSKVQRSTSNIELPHSHTPIRSPRGYFPLSYIWKQLTLTPVKFLPQTGAHRWRK